MTNKCKNIETIQDEYKENFFRLYDSYFQEGITYELATRFIDEINSFWYKNKEFLNYEIERLTKNNSCFLLCGAIYLDIKEFEHYFFKTFGDYHFLPDPFLKLESFFSIPKGEIDLDNTLGYFSRVLRDTVEILSCCPKSFYFIPMRLLAIENESKHIELIDSFFIRFISKMCNQEFKTKDDFITQNWRYEDIEMKLSGNLSEIIFSEIDESSKSLREKIDYYIQSQMNIKILTNGKSDSEIFLICLFSWLSQVLDILLICSYLRVTPYIRFSITFHYLTLVMYTFIEDNYLKTMIEKSIIFYIFRKSHDYKEFIGIDFNEYEQKVKQVDILKMIIKKMEKENFNIFEGGVEKLEKIITQKLNEFNFIKSV